MPSFFQNSSNLKLLTMKNIHGLLNSCYPYSHMDFLQRTSFLSFQVLHRFSFPRKVREHVLLCMLTARDVTITRLWRNGKTGVFYLISCAVTQIYCWVMRQVSEKFWQDLIPDEKNYCTEKMSVFLLPGKNNKQTWLHYFVSSSSLMQKSWPEMHMNKNVWIHRSLFISALYTSKL